MALPSLALVPPTPTYESSDGSDSMQSSPAVSFYSASSSTTTATTVSGKRLSLAKPPPDGTPSGLPRSSEEAVFIYSMYGDERSSWAPKDRNSKYASKLRTSVQSQSELAYDVDPPIIDLTGVRENGTAKSTVNVNGNARHSRPLPDLNRTTITTLSSTTDESRLSSSYHRSPSSSPRASLTAPSTISQRRSLRDLPPIPTQSQVKSTTPPGTPPPPAFTPNLLEANSQLHPELHSGRSRSPSHTSETSRISNESGQSAAPSASASVSSPPLKHRPQSYNNNLDTSGGKSKVSLAPSEGEDLDAFHVRNTYAQLDVSGVKGDGYVEGVERTRARIGDSRASQANAAAAIGDGTEKQGDLDPREVALLSNIDRYGFFVVPNHERLMLLPSAPLRQRLSPVQAGPANAPTAGKPLRSLPSPTPPLKEASRIAKWERMLLPQKPDPGGNPEGWYIKPSKEGKLLERVYKGIPDRWRSVAWEVLMSRHTAQEIRERGLGPDESRKMNLKVLREDYIEGLEKPSSYDIQIDLDVPRTIGGHVLFKTRYGAGQRSLFHVLHSFSLRCPICGYVQGMGPIAATLLCYLPADQVYACLVRLHDHYSLHTIFSPGFPGLLEAIYIQERITQQMMPGVYKAFKDQGISTTSYATKWYITLFANSVPFQTQLRIWDVFFAEGRDVFIVFSVGIVWMFRDQITSSSANFETVLSLLSSFFVPEDDNVLMGWIERVMGDSGIRANMRKWREEWKEMVKEGKEMDALL
ncbi:hypothetical protein D9758_002439 [Tetrapyrgos nigripes]|uniref:Rab-GAP TBC domain-containing protein n=1 Tax=Tetrapyrgos nigripes TaxID=182062 RepID=A0A8H5GPF1_9AGAR|nr:hypothetical protein D9758_002439 [Tetrapyrgos nigripes]